MAKIIAIEGIDRVGKTTLAKILSNETGMHIYKDHGYYDHNHSNLISVVEKTFTFIEVVKQLDLNVICDRFFLTEVVYSAIERNRDYVDEYFNIIHNKLIEEQKNEKIDITIIYVKPANIELSASLNGKNQSQHDELFQEYCNKLKLKTIFCDWSTLVDVVAWLKAGDNDD